jgi:SAM-dependent methyltransferase
MPSDLKPEYFRRLDDSDDELFYLAPRFVVHIDDAAIRTVGEIYLSRLPRGGAILDLMSSWRSHLPPELQPARVVGLGLNRFEMEDNPVLTEIVTQNLNRTPQLPFDDASFDGAVLTVSVQYLIHPLEVFAEVGRVLKPGAPFIVTFPIGCFRPRRLRSGRMRASSSGWTWWATTLPGVPPSGRWR